MYADTIVTYDRWLPSFFYIFFLSLAPPQLSIQRNTNSYSFFLYVSVVVFAAAAVGPPVKNFVCT